MLNHPKFTQDRRYNQLTVEQAEQVARDFKAQADPWLYLYVVYHGRVIDRYLLSAQELVRV